MLWEIKQQTIIKKTNTYFNQSSPLNYLNQYWSQAISNQSQVPGVQQRYNSGPPHSGLVGKTHGHLGNGFPLGGSLRGWDLPLTLAASLASTGERLKHRRLVNMLIWKQPQGTVHCLCVYVHNHAYVWIKWASVDLLHACLWVECECECMQVRAVTVKTKPLLHSYFMCLTSASRTTWVQLVREKWIYLLCSKMYPQLRNHL